MLAHLVWQYCKLQRHVGVPEDEQTVDVGGSADGQTGGGANAHVEVVSGDYHDYVHADAQDADEHVYVEMHVQVHVHERPHEDVYVCVNDERENEHVERNAAVAGASAFVGSMTRMAAANVNVSAGYARVLVYAPSSA